MGFLRRSGAEAAPTPAAPSTDAPVAETTPPVAQPPVVVPVVEPVTLQDGLRAQIHHQLLEVLGPTLYDANMEDSELGAKVRTALSTVLQQQDVELSEAERSLVTQQILDDILGYGPLEPYLRDREVTEVMVNGHEMVWVERGGLLYEVPASFADEAHLRRTIDKIVSKVGRRVDEASPMVDARLPDGSRVNAIVPPIALKGSALTIRKFSAEPFTVQDLIGFGTMPASVATLLDLCVRGRLNIIISGGTGSGKTTTTTLNVLSSFVPGNERIVTVEDVAELKLNQRHVVPLEARTRNIEGKGEVSIRDLVRNGLRMRPDRIVVGEIRDGAALDMLQAMNTGHDGSITTLHSNGPRDTLSRLETMVLMAGMDLPVRVIREQVASAIDVVVHQARLRDGTRRITHVTEIVGMESDVVTTQDLFTFDFARGVDERGRFRGMLRPTGIRPHFSARLQDLGLPVPPDLFGGRT
jgi:pilus assembly protein CpaF